MKKRSREAFALTEERIWYNNWIKENAKGNVLDVGKSRYMDYGFPTLDVKKELNPTFIGDILHTDFKENTFDTILCNGVYQEVWRPQMMVDEIYRILKPGGIVIFGFPGKDYPPYNIYKTDWKFYDNNIDFGGFKIIETKDFNKHYHFIICQK